MNLANAVKTAVLGMGTSKMRSGLTMLGIIIGVAAVIAITSIGTGATSSITSSLQSIGTNLVTVVPGTTSQGGVRSGFGGQLTLTYEDAQALANPANVPDAMAVAPILQRSGQVVAGPNNYSTNIVGTTPDYETVRNVTMAGGLFITNDELSTSANVAVLGDTVAKELFGLEDPVGQRMQINRITFQVIGVMASKGGSPMFNQDDQVVIPYSTAHNKMFGGRDLRTSGQIVSSIAISAASANVTNDVVAEATQVLEQRHLIRPGQPDDFSIQNQADLLSNFSTITTLLTAFLAAIAGISLVVGGIGIMNIMLVSVAERTREIGIRKAVGARRGDILLQFLVEAMVVGVTGGAVGIILGIGISEAIRITGLIQPIVSISSILLATFFSIGTGLFFGIYPARRASLLDPVEALRSE